MGRARIRAILAALRAALAGLLLLLMVELAGAAAPPAVAARALAAEPEPVRLAAPDAAVAGGGAVTPVAVQSEDTTPGQTGPVSSLSRPLQPAGGRRTGARVPAAAEPPAANTAAIRRAAGLQSDSLRHADQRSAAAAAPSSATGQPGGAVLAAATPSSQPAKPPAPSISTATAGPQTAQAPAAGAATSRPAASLLERRLQQWPAWRLPAPLPRPGRRAPLWPAWFSGEWLVESTTLPADGAEPLQAGTPWRARFRPDGHGGAVAERAFNALSVGRSQLGEQLLSVQDDPRNPQRQLARLAGDRLLETTLIGQRGEEPGPRDFLNDELSLLVLHGPGEPRLSRIETLGRWRLQADGSIAGEQWQARYGSPGDGLAAAAMAGEHWRLRLVPVPPGSDRATGTGAPAAGYR